MGKLEPMSESQIEDALREASEWSLVTDAIQRTYQFKDFLQSMKFVNAIAEAAESAQHHPDILIRWNKVTLTLSTHDAGGITKKDFDFAAKAEALFNRQG